MSFNSRKYTARYWAYERAELEAYREAKRQAELRAELGAYAKALMWLIVIFGVCMFVFPNVWDYVWVVLRAIWSVI